MYTYEIVKAYVIVTGSKMIKNVAIQVIEGEVGGALPEGAIAYI